MAVERYRPSLHFTTASSWINDPNGLVYYDGEYHLFYQNHPYSNEQGPMHWGHAVSRDLIRWEELSVAIYPDALGVIFSGSAVIDWRDTAGFGREAIVAMYTSHDDHAVPRERQSIAGSTDRGRTFTAYEGNPVLMPPADTPDFRDPHVFWYGGESDGYWVVVLAAGDEVHFYRSDDLRTWTMTGRFGRSEGAHGGVWECPDLFPLLVEGSGETIWMLIVGINPGGHAGGSGTQYFVGHFDGATFHNANSGDQVLWLDHGSDAYATQSWSDVTDGRRIVISWMSNWHYARTTPTSPWRGSMTLPRTLHARMIADGVRVVQRPVEELKGALEEVFALVDLPVRANSEGRLDCAPLRVFDLEVDLVLAPEVARAGIRLRDGEQGVVTIAWDAQREEVWIDRSASGVVDFNPDFGARHAAPLALVNGRLSLRIVVDAASVELFANDGIACITDSVYPHTGDWGIALFAEGGDAVATRVAVRMLAKAP